MKRPVRIANVSGFYGDRPGAMVEQLAGGDVDVLTGDYLAELTMLILARTRQRHSDGGYARSFVKELLGVLEEVLKRGVKVVVNAGGLDPLGCATAVQAMAASKGLSPVVASITGDDLIPRLDALRASGEGFTNSQTNAPFGASFVTANAYLGGWGITEALNRGADIVITGRVTDAALVSGTAAWWHGWDRYDYDRLAGSVVAGHIIECGMQATGGNYSFFTEIDDLVYPGFPWAEIAADGSSVIGKHADTGGTVTRETVISQLLYEIGGPAYLGPDVTTRFDTVKVEGTGPDRVSVSGVRGEAPPATLKVAAAVDGGFRNSVTIGMTGLHQDLKVALLRDQIWRLIPFAAAEYDEVTETTIGAGAEDPATNGQAVSFWQLSVSDSDEGKVGRAFSNAATQTALGNIPGMFGLTPPSGAIPFARYWPTTLNRRHIQQTVSMSGEQVFVLETEPIAGPAVEVGAETIAFPPSQPSVRVPLGTVVGARSGDKGGSANLGVYARSPEGFGWLSEYLTVHQLRLLLPETEHLEVERHAFPNLWAINFVIYGLLGDGVSSSLRLDPQAKGLGEYLRAKFVEAPAGLVNQ